MTRATSLGQAGSLCLLILAISACEKRADESPAASLAELRQGFRVGDTIVPLRLRCLKQASRDIGKLNAVQLVTFSSPGDCQTGLAHLAGLDTIAREGRGPTETFIVAYAPGVASSELGRIYEAQGGRDVCGDSSGLAWDALKIEKTPVTVLLISGRVAYVTDKRFPSPSSRERLMTEIGTITLSHQAASHR